MASRGWTQSDVHAHYARIGKSMPSEDSPHKTNKERPLFYGGPVNFFMTLYGHVPSKKNAWRRGQSGVMFIPSDIKQQIDSLTTQALHAWGALPIENPDLTVTFYVYAQRQDQDGMYTTILDCLQDADVIVNDNIAHFNGTKVLKPCVLVSEERDERVEIEIRKDVPLSRNGQEER